MGKLGIGYQKLYDAFFRFQIKSKHTMHGELYYENNYIKYCLKFKRTLPVL